METSFLSRRLVLVALLVLAALPYFVNLGASSLWDSNEAFYAETPREMTERGDYINPNFNYRPRFNKPPLVYWIVALFYNVFGVSEAAERVPIALGALVLIGTALLLGRAAFSTEAGLMAAIALASTPRFLMFSRRIIIDVYLAMFMSLALLMFVLYLKQPHRRRLYLVLMYVSVGLGVLTKGPVAVLLPAAMLFLYLYYVRPSNLLRRLRHLMLPLGILIILVIVVPWYAAVYSEHGWGYIKSFLLADNISRYTEAVWGPQRGFFFYFPVIAGDLFPWAVFLPFAIWHVVRQRLKHKNTISETASNSLSARAGVSQTVQLGIEHKDEIGMVLLIWIAVIVVFFSLSRSKQDLYVLPIYPAAAAVIGGLLARPRLDRGRRAIPIALATAAVLVAGLGGGLFYVLGKLTPVYELAGGQAIAYLALAGGSIAALAVLTNRRGAAVLALSFALIAINWVFVLRSLPDFEKYKPVRALCQVIGARAGQGAKVGYYKMAYPSMVFYLQRPIFEYYSPEQLQEVFSSGDEVYCVMGAEEYEAIKEVLPVPTRVLASRPVFQVKLNRIFDKTEIPQVVLISNNIGARSLE